MKKCGQAVGPDPHISILEDFMTEQLYEHENHELVRTASDRMEEFLIAPQYLLAKFPVAFLEPNRCLLGNNVIHWTCPLPNRLSNFLVSAWQRSNSLRIGEKIQGNHCYCVPFLGSFRLGIRNMCPVVRKRKRHQGKRPHPRHRFRSSPRLAWASVTHLA